MMQDALLILWNYSEEEDNTADVSLVFGLTFYLTVCKIVVAVLQNVTKSY